MFGGKTIKKRLPVLFSLLLLFITACGSKYDDVYYSSSASSNSCMNISGDNVYQGEIQDPNVTGQIKLAVTGAYQGTKSTTYASVYGMLTINGYQFCCNTQGTSTVRDNDGSYGFETSDIAGITNAYLRCTSIGGNSYGTVTVTMPMNVGTYSFGKVFMTGDKKLEGWISVKSNYPDISSSNYYNDGSYLYFVK